MCPHVYACVLNVNNVAGALVSLLMCPHVYACVLLYIVLSLCHYACALMCQTRFLCVRCCSKCKKRKGRSAFKNNSRQSSRLINSLYDIYALNDGKHKKLAAQKLRRWGFNPDRRCALPVVCNELLIRCPGHEDDLFPGLDFRDRLHGLFTFLFRTLSTPFPRMGLSAKMKKVLDQRLTQIGLERIMRDPKTLRSFRVQKSFFTDNGMTGEDRVQWIFQVPHVLGHKALCLPETLRQPVLEAFATAQLMIVASRSFRAYNVAELRFVFDQGFKRFFTAMEKIHQINHDRIYGERARRHRTNPRKHPEPKRFSPQKTSVCPFCCM